MAFSILNTREWEERTRNVPKPNSDLTAIGQRLIDYLRVPAADIDSRLIALKTLEDGCAQVCEGYVLTGRGRDDFFAAAFDFGTAAMKTRLSPTLRASHAKAVQHWGTLKSVFGPARDARVLGSVRDRNLFGPRNAYLPSARRGIATLARGG